MALEIRIKKYNSLHGDDGHKVISVRVTEALLARLDEIARDSNRSRNNVICLLLESAAAIVKVEDGGR